METLMAKGPTDTHTLSKVVHKFLKVIPIKRTTITTRIVIAYNVKATIKV